MKAKNIFMRKSPFYVTETLGQTIKKESIYFWKFSYDNQKIQQVQ